jgi:hypothetical protein
LCIFKNKNKIGIFCHIFPSFWRNKITKIWGKILKKNHHIFNWILTRGEGLVGGGGGGGGGGVFLNFFK